MYLDGEDVTERLRDHEISRYASDVSAIPQVREFLLEMQRSLAREQSVIMDGRDIGTVVLPDATLKVFLTADMEERALRRHRELCAVGSDISYEQVLRDIESRDKNDSGRQAAPLKAAEDSILVDTTDITLKESEELICALIAEKLGI
jgi:cytidylate kinase